MRRIAAVLLLFTLPLNAAVYHEATCPSVDPARMKRIKRAEAIAKGSNPAADCHPEVRMRYLGVGGDWGGSRSAEPRTTYVSSYTRADGTVVSGHYRSLPDRSAAGTDTIRVESYTRRDGTVVSGYVRRVSPRE